jgi:hypothetical protein
LVKLSHSTVNLFCSTGTHKSSGACSRCKGTTCAIHQNNDQDVRRRIFKVDGDKPIVAPQHLFVTAAGEIINSAAYFITKGELEWMWVQAIRNADATFKWEPSGRSRAPESLRKASADKSQAEVPPTKKEVEAALDAIKRLGSGGRGGGGGGGGGGWAKIMQDAQKHSRVIIRSDDKRALDWGQGSLRSYRQFRNALIRDIGLKSPQPWARVIEEWLDDRDDETRRITVIAVEQLADPKSLAVLRKLVKKEKNELIAGRFFRAIAACGPDNRAAITAVGGAVKKNKSAVTRAHAVVGAGKLEDRKAVTQLLQTALQDNETRVRAVAAYVIAMRLDKQMLDALKSSSRAEIDDQVKDWMAKAVQAVESGDASAFKGFLQKVLDEEDEASAADRMERARKWLEDQEKGGTGEPKAGDPDPKVGDPDKGAVSALR